MRESVVLDAPSWDSRGEYVAVLIGSGGSFHLKVFRRSQEGFSEDGHYLVPWEQVGPAHFPLQPVSEPQWLNPDEVLLRVGTKSSAQKRVGGVVLWNFRQKNSRVIVPQATFYQVAPNGKSIIFCDAALSPSVMHLETGRQIPIQVPKDFRPRCFFYWSNSGNRVAFQSTLATMPGIKPARSPGSYILLAHIGQKDVTLTDLWFQELQRGYNAYGVGWFNEETILFGVSERQLKPGQFVMNPPTRFVLYKVAVGGSPKVPQKVWEADPKVSPSGGPLFWLEQGGFAYPLGREGRDYAIYLPKEKRLQQLRFPEPTWAYSVSPKGDMLLAVNQAQKKVYAAVVSTRRVLPLPV